MAKVAPEPHAPEQQTMDPEMLIKKYGEMEAKEGAHDYVTMKDGWKLHRETWIPADTPPKAVFLFLHGNGESTRTMGCRRLAHACLKRGIIFEAFDRYGHGASMEKNGKRIKQGFQGAYTETTKQHDDHAVEIAELVIKKHALPFAFGGHSGGGMTACLATDRIIALCEENKVPFLTAVYMAPGLGFFEAQAPCGLSCCHCCCVGCWICCCCNCCGQPCLKCAGGNHNPNGALGPDNTMKAINCDQFWIETMRYPKGPPSIAQGAAEMSKLKDGREGLVYWGTKDEGIPRKTIDKLGELVPALKVEVAEGKPHDFLNINKEGDLTSVEVVEFLMSYVAEKLKTSGAQ